MTSVGQLPGLRPRRRPRDGGEVAGADMDLMDALDPLTWRTVAAWLHGRPSLATRQVGLQVLASFLRWLRAQEPALELLSVTGAHLDAYCAAARIGALPRTPGRPLTDKTVARKRSTLLSFYTFAWQCGVVRHNPVPGSRAARVHRADSTRTLTREERRLLRQGIARLAADGRTGEAAAVALLESTGASADALAALTRQDVHSGPGAGGGTVPVVIIVRQGRDDLAAFRVPPMARPLLRLLCASRPAGEPLIRRSDGRPPDLDWLRDALTEAALAGGIPEQRARRLHPNMLRATTVTDLLQEAGLHGS
ncbi:tyrosine-type recombinase/integrase [Nonomuraea sp. NPDC049480]|uniref:tyrosine-type recombinase/integrase n=1 Tax=Nonomuraea sp. NPDC049480 TaxID=3364353 RepID=UPI00379F0525